MGKKNGLRFRVLSLLFREDGDLPLNDEIKPKIVEGVAWAVLFGLLTTILAFIIHLKLGVL